MNLAVLNVGAGDTKLTFDPSKPAERERAAKIVTDMLKRGYSILVQIGEETREGKKEPIYRRAHGFDEKTCEYIIVAGPDETIAIGDMLAKDAPGEKRKPGRPRKVRVPAEAAPAVSVARRAGG